MGQRLANKQIVLGVTGGIAAYKSPDLVRRLREGGADVRVVMTENAKRFITPLTLQAVSGHPVHDDLFDVAVEAAMGHIELARWADMILVAPASADFMARLAKGMANDLLTTLCVATEATIAVAPAMNQGMWKNSLTQENLQALINKKIAILGPAEGSQACGDVGLGRLLEPTEIVKQVETLFDNGLLANVRVMVTAGPTHEAIDPVRFITNHSSGKMGYALAEAAYEAGAIVTLISGPTSLPAPKGVKMVSVVSAQDMHDAVMKTVADCDMFFSVAAVSDYRPTAVADKKIAKSDGASQLVLELTPDILQDVASLANKPFLVGFAAETHDVLEHAKAKQVKKKLDIIIANQVGSELGFGVDDNEVTMMWPDKSIKLAKMSKKKLARKIIELIQEGRAHATK